MKLTSAIFVILVLLTCLTSCAFNKTCLCHKNKSEHSVNVDMLSTSDPNVVYGKIKISETSKGLLVKGAFTGVPNPGKHGLHVHENGSCADTGKAAGGHFNPDGHQHGLITTNGYAGAHAGDMGNVVIDQKGNGVFSILLPESSLTEGKYNIAGKAVVLHEKEDDYGQPVGNAGGRIGCGIIPNL